MAVKVDKKVMDVFLNTQIERSGADNESIVRRLAHPSGQVDMVLDTDTYNEIDDQFALAYALKSEKTNVKAVYAAPFLNEKCSNMADGVGKSYDEAVKVLGLCGRDDLKASVYRGCESYLPSETEPVHSPAAEDLARRAMNYTEDNPLYVVAIAAITDVASAILINPQIIGRIVVVWLGGNAQHWPNNHEFNLYQDIAAARVVFGCGVPLVELPCMGVVSAFRTTGPELERHLQGKNALCDYLVDVALREGEKFATAKTWSRCIWDVTAVAWLTGDENEFVEDSLVVAPIPEYDDHWGHDCTRHLMRRAYFIHRDELMGDLFEKLGA